jgi:hypothetical protein
MSSVQSSEISASVRKAFDFSVDKFPLSGPDAMKTPWYALFRSDTSSVVGNGSVTSRYVPHTTDDVCALVDAAGAAFDGELECKTHFREGHYVSIQPTRAKRLKVYGENDNVWPRILINAGYDGRAFRASMGYYRDACRNLSMMRMVNGTSISIRHTSGLRGHMDALIEQFNTLKEGWTNLTDVIVQMQAVDVNMVDFLNQIYDRPSPEQLALAETGAKVRAVTTHENRTEAIWQRLNDERVKTGRPAMTDTVSAWEAFNAIQGYVQHDAQAKKGFKTPMDRIIRASRDKDVATAEKMVLALVA